MHTAQSELRSFSFDALRAQWYPSCSAQEAWKKSRADETFYPRSQEIFKTMLRSSANIYLDATNLNQEKRRFYVQAAKEHGYTLVGVVFSISMEELIKHLDKREADLQNGSRTPNEDVQMHFDTLTLSKKEEGFDRAFRLDTEGSITRLEIG